MKNSQLLKEFIKFDHAEYDEFGYFYYVVTGDTPSDYPTGAKVFKTPLNYLEFKEYVAKNSSKLHPCGKDTVFRYGIKEFLNPQVFCYEDFKNYIPEIIEV